MKSDFNMLPAILSYGLELENRARARNSLTRSDPTEPKLNLNSPQKFDPENPNSDPHY